MRKNDFIISNMIAAIIIAVIFSIASFQLINVSNIIVYLVALALYFGITLFFYYHIRINKNMEVALLSVGIVVWILIYFFETRCFANGTTNLSRHKIPFVLYFFLIITCSFIFYKTFYLIEDDCLQVIDNKKKIKNLYRAGIGLLITCINASLLYINDIFDNIMLTHHEHAYVASIINVFWGAPYDELFRSIYGHYGILYYIPVKLGTLMGVNLETSIIVAIMCFFAIVNIGCFMLLNYYVKSNLLYTLFSFSYLLISSTGIYFQLIPHRMLFPVIILVMITYCLKKKWCMIGWVFCCLSLVWNLDTGIVCTVVWMFANVYKDIHADDTKGKIVWVKNIIINLLLCIISFISSYIIVGIYNVINGGRFNTITEYVYPYLSSDYEISNLQTEFQSIFGGWWYIIIVVSLAIILYFFIKYLQVKQLEKYELFEVCLCLMSLGLLVYYINRTAWGNYMIVYIPMLLELAILIERFKKTRQKSGYLLLLVATILSFQLIANFGQMYGSRINMQYENYKFSKFCADVYSEIPDGTVCFGAGALELFARGNIDPLIYTEDWSDISKQNSEHVIESVIQSDCPYFFTTLNLSEEQLQNFTLVNEWIYDSSDGYLDYIWFKLYKRK